MKKINFFLFALIASATICNAQIVNGITTEEEYNYMTKGYQMQESSGLDMKKGYALGKTVLIKNSNYSFDFMPLLKIGKDSVLVGYIVKANSLTWGNKYIYGIPFGDIELLNKCFTSISLLDDSMTTDFFKAYVGLQTGIY